MIPWTLSKSNRQTILVNTNFSTAVNMQKLERFGKYTIIRPDPRALWKPSLDGKIWDTGDARYDFDARSRGTWVRLPDNASWKITFKGITFPYVLPNLSMSEYFRNRLSTGISLQNKSPARASKSSIFCIYRRGRQ